MSAKKLITVVGATGNQGGSVIAAVLDSASLSAKYALRGITRDPSKPAGQALAAKGVEVVQADLGDVGSIRKAVAGSYAVFGVTNYWEQQDGAVEEAQGRAIADAAFQEGVRHLVWSSLPYTNKITEGQLPHIYHFDAKARVQEYIEAQKAPSGTWATHVMPAFFMSNIKDAINKGPDGTYAWAVPFAVDAPIPLIDVRADTGKFVLGALEAGAAADGASIHAASEWSSPARVVQQLNATAGTAVAAVEIPYDTFKGFLPPPLADELGENFRLIGEYQYYGKGTDKTQTASDKFVVDGATKTSWEEYVQRNGPWNFA